MSSGSPSSGPGSGAARSPTKSSSSKGSDDGGTRRARAQRSHDHTGLRSGRPHRRHIHDRGPHRPNPPIEVWFYRVAGEIYLTTRAARRSWYANLLANPCFTFHLKHGVRADLPATATPVLDPEHRRSVFSSVIADLGQPMRRGYIAQPVEPLEAWLEGSPLMRVRFE